MNPSWISLALCQAGVIGVVAMAVRVQFGILQGYDLTVAASVVIASEITVFIANQIAGGVAIPLAIAVAWGLTFIVTYVWTLLALQFTTRGAERGGVVFLASLGVSTAVSGLVGIIRGPGLIAPDARLSPLEIGATTMAGVTWFGIACSVVAVAALVLWRRTVPGWGAVLLEQNPAFAQEIGVQPEQVIVSASAAVGGCAAVAGAYQGLANGSTPESGMLLLIYGIGAAFIVPGRGLLGAAVGAAIFGTASVVGGLAISPVVASTILFGVTAAVLLVRGTSRLERGLR
jgi:branched-subunit amino acid ABC-type transport system permease component